LKIRFLLRKTRKSKSYADFFKAAAGFINASKKGEFKKNKFVIRGKGISRLP
jgi:hypothetical protein